MVTPSCELFVHYSGGLGEGGIEWLRAKLEPAIADVVSQWPESGLAQLTEIEISLIDDATIGQIHGDFMDDPTPTDVITFPHGEILVSVETAAREGEKYGKDERGETLMYIVHGLMHLAGFDDLTAEDAAEMAREQEAVWVKLIEQN